MAKFDSKYTNTSYSMLCFFIITTIFFTIKYYSEKKSYNSLESSNKTSRLYTIIYILFVIIGQLFINVYITKNICGKPQWGSALSITIIPWVLIFMTLCTLLIIFPGWLAPFSNTFGYAIAYASGLNGIANKILKPQVQYQSNNTETKAIQESLALISQNRSLFLNEITQVNFGDFWKRIKPLMKSGVNDDYDLKERLYSMVVLKNIVAEYIWYILTGFLVCSVGYNYLVTVKCKDPEDLKLQMKNTKDELKNINKLTQKVVSMN